MLRMRLTMFGKFATMFWSAQILCTLRLFFCIRRTNGGHNLNTTNRFSKIVLFRRLMGFQCFVSYGRRVRRVHRRRHGRTRRFHHFGRFLGQRRWQTAAVFGLEQRHALRTHPHAVKVQCEHGFFLGLHLKTEAHVYVAAHKIHVAEFQAHVAPSPSRRENRNAYGTWVSACQINK